MRPTSSVVACAVTFVIAFCCLGPAAQAQMLELTFDDGPDGSGVADGRSALVNLQEGGSVARLEGAAHRSAITEGRYGRAAVFDGGADAVAVERLGVASGGTLEISLWLRVVGAGWVSVLERSAGVWAAGDGALALRTWNAAIGDYVSRDAGSGVPVDGAFHHLQLHFDFGAGTLATVVDFGAATTTALDPLTLSDAPVRFGLGLRGAIDELYVFVSERADSFDLDPQDCGAPGLICQEEVLVTTPRGWGWPVPVRVKTVLDPARGAPGSRCRLLIDVSGGGKCNNDYEDSNIVVLFARAGYAVSTVDPYC